jgi:hypothetical protein
MRPGERVTAWQMKPGLGRAAVWAGAKATHGARGPSSSGDAGALGDMPKQASPGAVLPDKHDMRTIAPLSSHIFPCLQCCMYAAPLGAEARRGGARAKARPSLVPTPPRSPLHFARAPLCARHAVCSFRAASFGVPRQLAQATRGTGQPQCSADGRRRGSGVRPTAEAAQPGAAGACADIRLGSVLDALARDAFLSCLRCAFPCPPLHPHHHHLTQPA